jgi:hypothetical protein
VPIETAATDHFQALGHGQAGAAYPHEQSVCSGGACLIWSAGLVAEYLPTTDWPEKCSSKSRFQLEMKSMNTSSTTHALGSGPLFFGACALLGLIAGALAALVWSSLSV